HLCAAAACVIPLPARRQLALPLLRSRGRLPLESPALPKNPSMSAAICFSAAIARSHSARFNLPSDAAPPASALAGFPSLPTPSALRQPSSAAPPAAADLDGQLTR